MPLVTDISGDWLRQSGMSGHPIIEQCYITYKQTQCIFGALAKLGTFTFLGKHFDIKEIKVDFMG